MNTMQELVPVSGSTANGESEKVIRVTVAKDLKVAQEEALKERLLSCGWSLSKETKKLLGFRMEHNQIYVVRTKASNVVVDVRIDPDKFSHKGIEQVIDAHRLEATVTDTYRYHSGMSGFPDGKKLQQKKSIQVLVTGVDNVAALVNLLSTMEMRLGEVL